MIDERERGEWERMRLICAYTIQPHSRTKVNIRKMMSFPWDNKSKKESQNAVSREEGRDRYLNLLKKMESTKNGTDH